MARDVQNMESDAKFRLSRVGITGVKKPVVIRRKGKAVTLHVVLDLFVDLPANQRGSHLSRNAEAINELIEEAVHNPAESLEEFCARLARDLLTRHPYAEVDEVHASADYFLERTNASGGRSLEPFKLLARAEARRSGDKPVVRKMVGVQVVGMTACPCAMETARELLHKEHGDPKLRELLEKVPSITHNQRNTATLMVEVPEGYPVEADDLIAAAEESLSAPTHGLLKRGDEGALVLAAHKNPKFVEDVVRGMLTQLLLHYSDLPDDAHITARSESEESIHRHNAVAERTTTMGELRIPYPSEA
jgi:GTP cyclohydrolase IV